MADQAQQWLRKQPLCTCWRAIFSVIDDEEEGEGERTGASCGSGKDLRRAVGTAAEVGESVAETSMVGATAVGLAVATAESLSA